LSVGNHHLRDLKLPAIDLSPVGNACGVPIDGILGVDLLDKMAATIDLKREVASLGVAPGDPKAVYDEMEKSMGSCATDFEQGKREEFEACLDPEIVFYTPNEEFRGAHASDRVHAKALFPICSEDSLFHECPRRTDLRKRSLVLLRVRAGYSGGAQGRPWNGDVPKERRTLAPAKHAQLFA
jgi:hypothetical protein